jgi:PAS domain S-box-containing protein
MLAVLDLNYVILDVNDCFVETTGRTPEQLIGRNAFEVFPGNPADASDTGSHELRESFDRARTAAEPDVVRLIRYDIEDAGRPHVYEERYWSVVTSPLVDEDGHVTSLVVCVHEATAAISQMKAQASIC